ncbi:hypothetical protein HDU96_008690 [Phlyctochytrium bullatum]|nr:hypothetical protein HDU96_008690 [Phlyctochytrium bullatum]
MSTLPAIVPPASSNTSKLGAGAVGPSRSSTPVPPTNYSGSGFDTSHQVRSSHSSGPRLDHQNYVVDAEGNAIPLPPYPPLPKEVARFAYFPPGVANQAAADVARTRLRRPTRAAAATKGGKDLGIGSGEDVGPEIGEPGCQGDAREDGADPEERQRRKRDFEQPFYDPAKDRVLLRRVPVLMPLVEIKGFEFHRHWPLEVLSQRLQKGLFNFMLRPSSKSLLPRAERDKEMSHIRKLFMLRIQNPYVATEDLRYYASGRIEVEEDAEPMPRAKLLPSTPKEVQRSNNYRARKLLERRVARMIAGDPIKRSRPEPAQNEQDYETKQDRAEDKDAPIGQNSSSGGVLNELLENLPPEVLEQLLAENPPPPQTKKYPHPPPYRLQSIVKQFPVMADHVLNLPPPPPPLNINLPPPYKRKVTLESIRKLSTPRAPVQPPPSVKRPPRPGTKTSKLGSAAAKKKLADSEPVTVGDEPQSVLEVEAPGSAAVLLAQAGTSDGNDFEPELAVEQDTASLNRGEPGSQTVPQSDDESQLNAEEAVNGETIETVSRRKSTGEIASANNESVDTVCDEDAAHAYFDQFEEVQKPHNTHSIEQDNATDALAAVKPDESADVPDEVEPISTDETGAVDVADVGIPDGEILELGLGDAEVISADNAEPETVAEDSALAYIHNGSEDKKLENPDESDVAMVSDEIQDESDDAGLDNMSKAEAILDSYGELQEPEAGDSTALVDKTEPETVADVADEVAAVNGDEFEKAQHVEDVQPEVVDEADVSVTHGESQVGSEHENLVTDSKIAERTDNTIALGASAEPETVVEDSGATAAYEDEFEKEPEIVAESDSAGAQEQKQAECEEPEIVHEAQAIVHVETLEPEVDNAGIAPADDAEPEAVAEDTTVAYGDFEQEQGTHDLEPQDERALVESEFREPEIVSEAYAAAGGDTTEPELGDHDVIPTETLDDSEPLSVPENAAMANVEQIDRHPEDQEPETAGAVASSQEQVDYEAEEPEIDAEAREIEDSENTEAELSKQDDINPAQNVDNAEPPIVAEGAAVVEDPEDDIDPAQHVDNAEPPIVAEGAAVVEEPDSQADASAAGHVEGVGDEPDQFAADDEIMETQPAGTASPDVVEPSPVAEDTNVVYDEDFEKEHLPEAPVAHTEVHSAGNFESESEVKEAAPEAHAAADSGIVEAEGIKSTDDGEPETVIEDAEVAYDDDFEHQGHPEENELQVEYSKVEPEDGAETVEKAAAAADGEVVETEVANTGVASADDAEAPAVAEDSAVAYDDGFEKEYPPEAPVPHAKANSSGNVESESEVKEAAPETHAAADGGIVEAELTGVKSAGAAEPRTVTEDAEVAYDDDFENQGHPEEIELQAEDNKFDSEDGGPETVEKAAAAADGEVVETEVANIGVATADDGEAPAIEEKSVVATDDGIEREHHPEDPLTHADANSSGNVESESEVKEAAPETHAAADGGIVEAVSEARALADSELVESELTDANVVPADKESEHAQQVVDLEVAAEANEEVENTEKPKPLHSEEAADAGIPSGGHYGSDGDSTKANPDPETGEETAPSS